MTDPIIMARLAAIELRLAALESARGASGVAPAVVAPDLDGPHGNPRVRFGLREKYWHEQPDPNVGKTWSQCSPEYLDAAARYLDACAYMARKAGEHSKAGYKDRDAARCRGWAARIRGGWRPPPEPESPFGDSSSFDFGANADVDADEEKPL